MEEEKNDEELKEQVEKETEALSHLIMEILSKFANYSTGWGMVGFLLGWIMTWFWIGTTFLSTVLWVKIVITIAAALLWLAGMPANIISKIQSFQITPMSQEEYEKYCKEHEEEERK